MEQPLVTGVAPAKNFKPWKAVVVGGMALLTAAFAGGALVDHMQRKGMIEDTGNIMFNRMHLESMATNDTLQLGAFGPKPRGCACSCCSACGGYGCSWMHPCINGGGGCTGNCHGWS